MASVGVPAAGDGRGGRAGAGGAQGAARTGSDGGRAAARGTLEKARELFVREGAALERLSHPNVVGYRDLFEHGGALVLATEYVDGDTLEAVIGRQVARYRQAAGGASPGQMAGRLPGLPLLRAWYYFEQLLGALAAIHALGIVHRDVKPSNVFIRRDGIVKLGDFGIARLLQAARRRPPRASSAPGTGAYMSPEQVLSQPVDARSDLYSAGIALYEMLSGQTPFARDRAEFLVRKDQVEATPPPIRTVLHQASLRCSMGSLSRALAKAPEQRFQSALEMGDAFRAGLGLPDAAEWHAQRDIARTALELKDGGPTSRTAAGTEGRLATLRDVVVRSYKTERIGSF